MAPIPLVIQLRFARHELVRCLVGVEAGDACRRLPPMNCLSWIVGHLANQENRYWVRLAQGESLLPELNALVGTGKPASTPPLEEMWEAWRLVTHAADRFLDTVTPEIALTHFEAKGRAVAESIGTLLYRNIYHYWYHTGEAAAIRQMLGHTGLPEFVGSLEGYEYRREE